MNARRAACVLLGSIASGAALGADQVVSGCANDTELRADLTSMQSQGGGTLTFACASSPATIVVSGPLPNIATATTIDGGGAVTVSGGNTHRIFLVNAGAALTLRRIAVTNALAQLDGGAISSQGALLIEDARFAANRVTEQSGGAILALGPLTIRRSVFFDNRAVNGGALYPRFPGAVTLIEDSLFESNLTTSPTGGIGGAILAWDGAPVTILRSEFRDNRGGDGATIYITSNSRLTMRDSTVRESTNNVPFPFGALHNAGTATVERSSFIGNTVSRGSAIYNSGTLDVVNSTFSGNGSYLTNPAAIMSGGGTTTVANSTFFDNPGAHIGASNGTLFVRNSVIDGGQACGGSATSQGYNVVSDASCNFTAVGDRQNTPSGLAPLGPNGGPTLTHVPTGTSVLVDAGTTTGCPATDQRGVARPVGASCDIGAVELTDALFANGFE